jgi:hypothetical protein
MRQDILLPIAMRPPLERRCPKGGGFLKHELQ